MAVTNADILGWLNANPGASPALINQTMAEAGVSAAQYQSATGAPPPPVPQAVAPQGMLSGPAPTPAPAPTAPAVSNADILGWFNANPNASDALIAQTMQEAGVSPVRLAQVTGAPVAEVVNRFQAAIAAPVAPTVAPSVVPSNPAVTNADILGWFNANPNADATLVNQTMQAAGVSPSQVSSALASNPDVAKTYLTQQILGQGTTEKWTGEGKGSPQANAADMAEILTSIGITDVSQFGQLPDGSFGNKLTGQPVPTTYGERQTGNAFGGTFSGSGNTGYRVEFDASGKPLFYTTGASSSDVPSWVKPALVIGGALYGLNAAGLLGGGAAAGAAGLTAAEAAGLGLTAAEAASLGISASEFAAAGGAVAGMGAGTGLTLSGAGGLGGAAGLPSLGGSLGTGITAAGAGGLGGATGAAGFGGALGTGVGAGVGGMAAANSLFGNAALGSTLAGLSTGVGASALGSTLGGLATGVGAGALGSAVGSAVGGGAASTLPAGVTSALTNAGVSTAVNSLLGGGGTTSSNLGNLFSGGLGTAGNLLQMQESREAAQRAQARIDAETAAAKASAAFRPVGMTTRFGTSQFQVDPVTGQLTSAGYTLSPEAKAQQDRFMALSQQGLTQAEQAQAQFAPLQTGAQRLFGLGNQYLAQSPEAVAQNYLNQQMALLQPGRELELANLQNRLQQQGRGGLAVAQGGTLGATTPELQALYNARAQQEAQLAANAQQAGQQQVLYGAGLLGQGTTAMGNYYAGQQAAYAPYTTAMGQVQGLETLGQQPLTTGINLGQISAQAGANVGQLGLKGAGLSTALATSADATRNLAAQSLIAAGNPNAQFGSAIGGLFGGGLQSAFSGTGLGSSGFGTGLAYGNQDLGLYL
jgi:hypothetical protein